MPNFWKSSRRSFDGRYWTTERNDSHTFAISRIFDSIIKFYGCLPIFQRMSRPWNPVDRQLWGKKVFEFSRYYRMQLDRGMNLAIYKRSEPRLAWPRPCDSIGSFSVFLLVTLISLWTIISNRLVTTTLERNPFGATRLPSIYIYARLCLHNYFFSRVSGDFSPRDKINASLSISNFSSLLPSFSLSLSLTRSGWEFNEVNTMFFNISWIFQPISSFSTFFPSSSLLRRETHKCAPREIYTCGLQINVDFDATPAAVESFAFSKRRRDNGEKNGIKASIHR